MNMATKNNIFQERLTEWLKASGDKKKRGEIIRHICFTTKMHPKSVARRFKKEQLTPATNAKRRGRPVRYLPDTTAALKDVWEASNELCGELLHPMISEYISVLQRDSLWKHGDVATGTLRAMSMRTVRRRVETFLQVRGAGKGISATKPSALKHIIPIFKGPWKDKPPGNGQVDTVVHCGNSLLGDMAFTLTYVDAAVYWIVLRAQWNKGQEATVESLKKVKKMLPFLLLGLHPDTGSEFINWLAKQWCDTEGVELSRSEPGKKNDNMYVEERNGHVVRKYLGYLRLDCREVVPLMNQYYEVLGLFLNHFVPVRRTLTKERVGSKYKRTYEKVPMTAYQRVLAHPLTAEEIKDALRKEHEMLNPLLLKRQLDTIRGEIYQVQKRSREA